MAASTSGCTDFMGWCTIPMLNSLPVTLIIGCVLGFLAGLGIGGGSLLILWLSLVIGLDHNVARTINLLFFIPTAIIASVFRWRQGSLDLKAVLPAIISGCVAAACFSLLSSKINLSILRKLFGILLLVTGVKELLYRPKNK